MPRTAAALFVLTLFAAACEPTPATEAPARSRPDATETAAPALTSAPAAAETNTPAAEAGDLHDVDWNAYLAASPDFEHPADVPPLPVESGPYLEVEGEDGVAGYAMTEGILYGDFSGDGRDEAVISLYSGGTAGNLGLLVYREGDDGPELVTVLPGYKIGAVADGDALVVREPHYAGWEPNCCASGMRETRYILDDEGLVVVAESDEGEPAARSMTVDKFYELLAARDFEEAYTFLSAAAQAREPYDDWVAGFDATESFTATTTDLPATGAVGVHLEATDSGPSGPTTRTYVGQWTLVWSAERGQWLLDEGELVEAP